MTAAAGFPPQPLPDPDSESFWQATAAGRLAMCRCTSCRRWHQPPLERCRCCGAPTAFEDVAGTGRIHTFIVQRQPAVSGYTEDLPYVVALVELDEQPGLRLPGRIVGVDPESVQCEMRVRAELVELPGGDYVVPVFHPV